jgi:hypothetical protein
MRMMKNKKALETGILVGIIITVVAGIVILLFIRGWGLKGIIDKEACHQSVVMRSMPSVIGDAMKKAIPLKCKTEDILINFDDEEFVKQRTANAMYGCWWMLGEGKLDFFTEGGMKGWGLAATTGSCVVCSTIQFSDRAKNKISSVDMTDYIQNTKIPLKNNTYMEYFSDEEGAKLPVDVKLEPLDTDKQYAIVYMGIRSVDLMEILKKDFGVAVGTWFLFGGKTQMATQAAAMKKMQEEIWGVAGVDIGLGLGEKISWSLLALKGGLGKLITLPIKGIMGTFMNPVTVGILLTQGAFIAQSAIASAVHCDGNIEGCNLIILTEYNKEELVKTCGNIESIP